MKNEANISQVRSEKKKEIRKKEEPIGCSLVPSKSNT